MLDHITAKADRTVDAKSDEDFPGLSFAYRFRDGHAERITDGWHPVVAAPGFDMYYLWALVGDTDAVDTRTHPRFQN